jgi:hypothetical protein
MSEDDSREKRSLRRFIGGYMEAFVSIAALVTAVAAVVITMEQTKVMREEAALERRNARISVMPSVWIGTHIGGDEDGAYFRIVMTNKGLGPAVLETFVVTYRGETVYNWDELTRKMAASVGSEESFENRTVNSSRSPVSPGLMLEAGGVGEPFGIAENTDLAGLKLFMRGSADMAIRACYCSLYGDCFETQLFRRPQEVEACTKPERPFISHVHFASDARE